jgi:hypothetical protein
MADAIPASWMIIAGLLLFSLGFALDVHGRRRHHLLDPGRHGDGSRLGLA